MQCDAKGVGVRPIDCVPGTLVVTPSGKVGCVIRASLDRGRVEVDYVGDDARHGSVCIVAALLRKASTRKIYAARVKD